MAPQTDAAEARIRQALTAAQLYYMQDHTMEAIARELGTSRSTVSRLLSFARESGLVDIRITSPYERGAETEDLLAQRYRVTAHVVPMPTTVSEVDRLERVAKTAARLLGQYIDSSMTVGVAWGSTISAVSRVLVPKPTHDCTFVQLNGAGNTQTTGVEYSSEILQRFGHAFSARVQHFPVPAFFDDPATKSAMWRERSTRRVLELQSRMDLAVFSIGSPGAEVPSRVYVGGYLDRDDYASLRADKAIGDIATMFFRADGTWKDIRLNARGTGPALDRLRRVPRRLCIAAGVTKAASLRAALASGLVTDVVVDAALAHLLATAEG